MATKLTKASVEKIRAPDPSGKQRIIWDSELKGFGVLVSGKTDARTFIAQRRLPTGIVRRVTVGAVAEFERVEDARQKAAKLLTDLREGRDPRAERRKAAERGKTLAQWLEDYLKGRNSLRPRSVENYRLSTERYLGDWLSRPLREITPDMIENRHSQVGEKYGAATANAAMRTFRAVYNFARDRDSTLPDNPTRRLKKVWFKLERRTRMVRADELPRFYKAVDQLPSRSARDYLLFVLFTGFRRNEAASLRWEDIDFRTRTIRLPAIRTKASRKLDLPMSSFVRDLLIARRGLGTEGPFVFAADSNSGYLAEPKFPLAQVAKATGIAVSVHDLRRTFITIAESTDISPLALKGLVNHGLGQDVTAGYIQMTAERLRVPAEKVAARIIELSEITAPEGVAQMEAAAQ